MKRLSKMGWPALLVCACTASQPSVSTPLAPVVLASADAGASEASDRPAEQDASASDGSNDSFDAAVDQAPDRVATPAMEVIPPSKASCDKFQNRIRALPSLAPELRHCCTPDGGCNVSADCEEAGFRMILVPRVLGGHPTIDEIKMMKALCRHKRDSLCVSCAEWLLSSAAPTTPRDAGGD